VGNDLLFVGNLSYAPNVDAVEWLAGEIMPLLDGVNLAVVGSNPDPAVRALASDRVRIAADVPDVAPHYADSRVAVVPIRAGGGSRIKVLEAYAHSRPVVATSAGIRGTELGDGPGPALQADDPQGFAAACRRLLDDPALAARLGAEGSEAVAAEGSVEVVAKRIAAIAGAIARPRIARTEAPLARSDVEVAEADDGYVVYDPARDRVHYLNHTAVLVLELCNGQNTEERIAAQLQRAYDLPEAPVQETRTCIESLVKEGLVE
jgi:hypothetical protein